MKQRFGALLCMLFGAVLMTTGLSVGGTNAGVVSPTCVPIVGGINSCPTGTITVTEVTDQKGAVLPLPAGGWEVDIASTNCTYPNGDPVAEKLTITDGGNATTAQLFVFANPQHGTQCQYTLTEKPVTGFTPTFAPASPVTIPFVPVATLVALADPGVNLAVTLTNTSNAAPTSSAPASTSAPAKASASTKPLAVTGPRSEIRVSLWIGGALFIFGLVLMFAGRRSRARH